MIMEKPERIQSIDALRGLSVILMVVYHFLFDLVAFLGAPGFLYTNPLFDLLQWIFAGTFILLAGVSSRFSKSNVRRGVKVFAAAVGVSLVTLVLGMPILFGILHFLSVCMVFYGLTKQFWAKIHDRLMPWLCVGLLFGSLLILRFWRIESHYLWPIGFTYPGFYSADYFPLFPWIFVFLLGTWLGGRIRAHRVPEWVYSINPPLLPAVGRRAFLIYLVHQPILYLLIMAIGMVIY